MTAINQKEYLKKYLSIGSDGKKKKKKKKPITTVKIIDDDIDVNLFNKAVEEDLMGATEDAPQVVGVIDDRPLQLRIDDYRKSDMWKPVGDQNDLAILEIKQEAPDEYEPPRKQENRRRDSDASPPRRNRRNDSSPVRRKHSDDLSPKRLRYSNDFSPVRRKHNDSSPPRRKQRDTNNRVNSNRNHEGEVRKQHSDDASPVRRNSHDRGSRNSHDRGSQKPKDGSPRSKRDGRVSRNREIEVRKRSESPIRKRDDDPSPPRRKRRDSDGEKSRGTSTRREIEVRSPRRKKPSRFSDVSPVRVKIEVDDVVGGVDDDGKMTKTLCGKKAGLQDAAELVRENVKFKKREDELFKSMLPEVSGAHSKTIIRDRKTGKIRDLNREADEKHKKQQVNEARAEKYTQWGKGLKQVEDYNQKLSEDLHEMNKPLARYADDEDLEKHLKEQEWAMDPMLAYIRKKRKKEVVKSNIPLKPQYEGEFMPNRYGVRPGYRWDGVDRSNGYEGKWITQLNSQNAQLEEMYKWSTEDM